MNPDCSFSLAVVVFCKLPLTLLLADLSRSEDSEGGLLAIRP